MPALFRLRTRLDAAILTSILAMAAMNVLVLAQQVQPATSLPVLA
jgi:hypothetical protein